MSDQGHNGYFNYETWNVCLWCDNEYSIYVMAQEHGDFDSDSAETFVKDIFTMGTPDMLSREMSYDDVDWQEVADNFNAE